MHTTTSNTKKQILCSSALLNCRILTPKYLRTESLFQAWTPPTSQDWRVANPGLCNLHEWIQFSKPCSISSGPFPVPFLTQTWRGQRSAEQYKLPSVLSSIEDERWALWSRPHSWHGAQLGAALCCVGCWVKWQSSACWSWDLCIWQLSTGVVRRDLAEKETKRKKQLESLTPVSHQASESAVGYPGTKKYSEDVRYNLAANCPAFSALTAPQLLSQPELQLDGLCRHCAASPFPQLSFLLSLCPLCEIHLCSSYLKHSKTPSFCHLFWLTAADKRTSYTAALPKPSVIIDYYIQVTC